MEQPPNCFELLKQRWLEELTELGCPPPEIFFCHRFGERAEHAGRFAGFQVALEWLSRSSVPVLIFGLQSEASVRSVARAGDELAIALLDTWPGAEYLRYDVSPDELRAAARRVIEGTKQPLSAHLSIRNTAGLLKLSSEIRHWLDNRRTAVKGMLENFRKASQGDTISPFHLIPRPAVSEEHRAMLERLWVYEPMAAALAYAIDGIVPLRSAMAEFEKTWTEFDESRAKLSLQEPADTTEAGSNNLNAALISRLEKVLAAISAAIGATCALDAALKNEDGNDADKQ